MPETLSQELDALRQGLPIIDFGVESPSEQTADSLRLSPHLVYHGAKEYFQTFDPKQIGLNSSISGDGVYTTTERAVAEAYSRIRIGNSQATPVVIEFVPKNQKLLDLRPYYQKTADSGFPKDFLLGFAKYLLDEARTIESSHATDNRLNQLRPMANRIKYFANIGQQIYPQDLKENFRINMLRFGRLPVAEKLKPLIMNNEVFDPLTPLMGIEDVMNYFGRYIQTLGITGMIAPEGGESHSDSAGKVSVRNVDAYVFFRPESIRTPSEWERLKK